MYAKGNPKTKKALQDWIESGQKIEAFSPGPFPCPANGPCVIEGPHYPEPHKWYAQVQLKDGFIVKVLK